jgi:hypothetical protein
MTGFTSQDDLIDALTNGGRGYRADWQKSTFATTAHTAGLWYSLFRGGGNPPADTVMGTGTNLSFQTLGMDTVGGAAIPNGGHVGANGDGYKVLLSAAAQTAAATTAPCVLMLVDLLGYYPITSVTTTTAQTLINSVAFTAANATDIITTTGYDIGSLTKVRLTTTGTLPAGLALATDYWTIRQSAITSKLASTYQNAENNVAIDFTTDGTGTHTITAQLPRYSTGAGVQAFLTPTTVMGAATPNLSIGYTNSEGTAGKATPTTLPIGNSAAAVTSIVYSGTGNGKFGPFMPLANGDAGVRSVQTATISTSYLSGVLNLVLCRPLLTLPITTLGVTAERDLVNQFASMPRVYDGACLAWLMLAGAATPVASPLSGHLEFGWNA